MVTAATAHPTAVGVSVMPFPPPYRAAFAICSDLDLTPSAKTYYEIARFMASTQATAMGPGVGLEIGNSIYFYMNPGQYAYHTTDDRGREMARALIRSGHIDVLHSYGDLGRTRDDAARAIDELVRHDLQIRTWVDHSKAPSNFGPDIMCGTGDLPDSPAYHADLTLAYGVRFIWRGRTTGVLGQDRPLTPAAIFGLLDRAHLAGSARNLAKESVKLALGACGSPRWRMYTQNRVLRASTLRDGRPIWEFLRSNPFWGGSGKSDTAVGFADVITPAMLDRLERRRGVCILYTHLGKVPDPAKPFPERTCAAFRTLADRANSGRIFVTTTTRLLTYLQMRDGVRYRTTETNGPNGRTRPNGPNGSRGPNGPHGPNPSNGSNGPNGALQIHIERIEDPVFGDRTPTPADLMGLTFRVPPNRPTASSVTITLPDGTSLETRRSQDATGDFITIPWKPLAFPDLEV